MTGIHYVAGLGATTLIAVFLLLLLPTGHDYSVTSACGGTLVIVIQWALAAFPALVRRYVFRQLLNERSAAATAACGAIGGVLVFGVPYLLRNVAASDAASALTTLLPLGAYPLAASFVVFRNGLPAAGAA